MNAGSEQDQIAQKKEQNLQQSQAQASKNALIDEKTLNTRKAIQKKEQEIQKHIQTIYLMKQKIAKAIIDKASKVEDMQKYTLEDLFKFTADREKAMADKTVQSLASQFQTKTKAERQQAMLRRANNTNQKYLAQSAAYYSSKFDLPQDITDQQAEIMRLKAKLDDKFFYQQEKSNRMQNAYELISVYKVLYDVETEVKDAQQRLKDCKDAYEAQRRGPNQQNLAFLKMLSEDGACVLVDKKVRKALNIRDNLDKAIAEDLQEI